MNPTRLDFIYGDLKDFVDFKDIPNDSFFRTRVGGGLTLWKKEDGSVFDEDNDPADNVVQECNFECVPLLIKDAAGDNITFDIPEEYKFELTKYDVYIDDDFENIKRTYFDDVEVGNYFLLFETVFRKVSATEIKDVSCNTVRDIEGHATFKNIITASHLIHLTRVTRQPLAFKTETIDETM
jgi:hypothetical protein